MSDVSSALSVAAMRLYRYRLRRRSVRPPPRSAPFAHSPRPFATPRLVFTSVPSRSVAYRPLRSVSSIAALRPALRRLRWRIARSRHPAPSPHCFIPLPNAITSLCCCLLCLLLSAHDSATHSPHIDSAPQRIASLRSASVPLPLPLIRFLQFRQSVWSYARRISGALQCLTARCALCC